MRYKRYILLLLLGFVIGPMAKAEVYSFRHPEKTRQLYGSTINALLEDFEGYLWIATSNGLYRYDGYGLSLLDEHSPSHLPDELTAEGLQEDATHHLWISTSEASSYMVLTPQRRIIDADDYLDNLGMGTKKQYLIHVGRQGNLWRVTEDSICHYDFATRQLSAYATPGLSSASNHRISVHAFDGMLYILDGKVLRTFSQRHNVWQEEILDIELPTLGGSSESVMLADCYVDLKGGLWIYSLFSETIIHRNPQSMTWERIHLPQEGFVGQNAIRSIMEDEKYGVWIATDHRGLFLFDPKNGKISHMTHRANVPNSLSSDNINTMLADSHHTLWLGYFRTGISFCQPELDLLSNRAAQCGEVTALLAADDDSRWIGTDGHGLWHETPEGRLTQLTQIPNLTVTDLRQDQQGQLWVSTYDRGIYRVDARGQVKHYDAQSGKLPHDGVQRMAIDSEGRLWVCSAFGSFYCFDPRSETSHIYKGEGGSDLLGQSICYDAERDRIILATFYGLWIQDLKTGEGQRMLSVKEGQEPFHSFQVSNLLPDDYLSLVWMTHRKGITAWDVQADTLYLLSRNEGLNGTVLAIGKDAQHNLWVSSVSGLYMIQGAKDASDQWAFNVRNFLTSDDTGGTIFNPSAEAITRQGLVLFGGSEGYSEVNSHSILSEEREEVHPRFSTILLGDSVLMEEQLMHLKYDDHPLTFTFYTGNPVNASDTRYAYRVTSLHNDWVETNTNSITLLSLPQGTCDVELKARGLRGEWSEVQKLRLKVSPPWWNSRWMWMIYIASLLALGTFLVFITRNWQRRKALAERKQLIREHQSRLAEMKLQFFTNISHDLRTPLTLIISPLEQLLKEKLPDNVNHRLKNMHKNAEELLNEITTLLDFRKLDVGAEKLRLGQPQDVLTFIRQQCDGYYDVARDRNIKFGIQMPTSPVMMTFDEDKLRKILYNLISNAFKHSPDGSEVNVRVEQESDAENMLKVSVSDQGPGVADEEKQRIFELFYQSSGNNPKPGSGIGLHIARQFVELHNGKLWVEDNKPQGAVFCFTLPFKAHETVEAIAQPQGIEAQNQEALPEFDNLPVDGKYAVLVVDDNQDLCHFIEESLSDDYRIFCAFSGEEALQVLDRENITLVVSDVMMPGISGLELCNRIKSDIRFSHIPVILLTARAADQSVLEGLQQGADDYLTKPFNVDRLRLRIAKFIEWAQRSHQSFQSQPDISPREITITSLDEKLLQKAIDVVNDNLQDANFGVEQLASEVGMSRSQLYKKLMALTGKSPLDFVRTMRMKRAKALLERSQLQVSEVAYQVGYNTLKTFTENFKQEYGKTPTEYKKSLQ